ncbi:MAG: iron-sulfur cluster assembly protein [Planctomycetota bacterium]|nr:iron-sulfur cluster assembly protein [Planctomycetota bacterium]
MSEDNVKPDSEVEGLVAEPEEAAAGEQAAVELNEASVREQLKQVIDPELFVNIVDLGLIYVVDLKASEQEGKQDVLVEMTMTSPMCPAGPQLVGNSRQAVESMEGVGEVEIKVVMDPPWTQDMMTDDAKDQLNIF